ncbi:glycosyltransferase 87 family protein [Streptomyces sp. NBC_01766]|uniref:glycosyltransferase 87 family protein n=1 Tax=Streptomyces sp. NBC_01766 TaxID=2975936 RepID=UPI002DDAF065|nr:glycosyltransferase 87 family protein [Streptomyces sp. NBC_01766]WSC21302.1 glycosyltransferase 87 family protein [Streptomyces sp. NBC_01766]
MITPPPAGPRTPRSRIVLAGVLLAALTATLVLTIGYDGYYDDPAGLSWWYAASWLLFAAAVGALRNVPVRRAAVLVLVGSAAVAATGLVSPPRTSTDAYRYAWDGRVQAAGISPYDHAPQDTALAGLRDSWLFPTGTACGGPDRAPVPSPGAVPHCTLLNRPGVHTIYPPVAEAYFYGVEQASPDGARLKVFQIAGAALSVAVTGALLLVLTRLRRGDPRWVAYWAWCPAVPIEAVNNAHVDVLGVLFTVAGLGLLAAGRRLSGSALVGAAIATKLMPAVVLPGALSGVRRVRDAATVLVPAAAVTALSYLPYALASHSSVFGYLSGYVEEEGYEDAAARNRYALLRLFLPEAWIVPVLVVVLALVTGYVLRRGDPERPWSGALLVTGTAFLLLTPGYSWYALLLIALVALDGRWEWLGVAVAGAARYVTGRAFDTPDDVGTTVYAIAAGAVLIGWAWRRRTATRAARLATAVPPDAGAGGPDAGATA